MTTYWSSSVNDSTIRRWIVPDITFSKICTFVPAFRWNLAGAGWWNFTSWLVSCNVQHICFKQNVAIAMLTHYFGWWGKFQLGRTKPKMGQRCNSSWSFVLQAPSLTAVIPAGDSWQVLSLRSKPSMGFLWWSGLILCDVNLHSNPNEKLVCKDMWIFLFA